jgi:hypothetical protein
MSVHDQGQEDWAREAVAVINDASDGRIVGVTFRKALDPLRQDVILQLDEPFDTEDLGHVRVLLRAHADRAGRHLRRLERGNPLVAVVMQRTDKGDRPPWLQGRD